MNALNPYGYVYLLGDGIFRGVTLELPSERVRGLLPHGLTLGEQTVTRAGTHPVVLLCNEILRAHMTVPSALPSLSYREQSLGIPFCYVTDGRGQETEQGPFYYQPRLWLDSLLAMMGGVVYWGLTKRMARFQLDDNLFAVTSQQGRSLSSVRSRPTGAALPVASYPFFAPIRQLHEQPLIMTAPFGMGPFFVCCNFDKAWDHGTLCPLETSTQIDESFVPGLQTGRFPEHGLRGGIDTSVVGSYELRLPWRLSLPYAPGAAPLMT